MTTTPTMTPVDTVLLDRAGRAADRAVTAILELRERLAAGDLLAAEQLAMDADRDAQSAYLTLVKAGAQVENAPLPLAVPIELLDTPEARELLDALQFAVHCAQKVDRQRGHILADGSGCGLTEAVGDIAERLRQQIEGPRGLD